VARSWYRCLCTLLSKDWAAWEAAPDLPFLNAYMAGWLSIHNRTQSNFRVWVSSAQHAAQSSARKMVERNSVGTGTEAAPAGEIKPARAKVASVAMTLVGVLGADQRMGSLAWKNDKSSSYLRRELARWGPKLCMREIAGEINPSTYGEAHRAQPRSPTARSHTWRGRGWW